MIYLYLFWQMHYPTILYFKVEYDTFVDDIPNKQSEAADIILHHRDKFCVVVRRRADRYNTIVDKYG